MNAKRFAFPRLFGGRRTARPATSDQFTPCAVVVGRGVPTAPAGRAFTLLELIAVLAVLVMLAASLLPAFCRSKANTKVTTCAANMRQWSLAVNLYAKDNKDWLPRFDPVTGGMYAWDVGVGLPTALAPYSLTLQAWFCPVRPNEMDAANIWALTHFGHPILTFQDLTNYFGHSYAGELIINYNWWVPRAQSTTFFPTDYSTKPWIIQPAWVRGSDPALYGWPVRVDDRASARVPFMSDTCASGQGGGLSSPAVGAAVTNISPNTAHFFNGVLDGVNAAFVDGHVVNRRPSQIRAVYVPPTGTTYWFY